MQLKYFTLLRDLIYNLRLCNMLTQDTSLCDNVQLCNDKDKFHAYKIFVYIEELFKRFFVCVEGVNHSVCAIHTLSYIKHTVEMTSLNTDTLQRYSG
jgi:hypothetical protein